MKKETKKNKIPKKRTFTLRGWAYPITLFFTMVFDKGLAEKNFDETEDAVFKGSGSLGHIILDMTTQRDAVYLGGVLAHEVSHFCDFIDDYIETDMDTESRAYVTQAAWCFAFSKVAEHLAEADGGSPRARGYTFSSAS